MNRMTGALTITALVVGALTADALGQHAPQQPPRGRQEAPPQRPAWQPREGAVESRALIGARVRTAEGRNLGEIDQLLVDARTGQVTHVVVGMGGFAGIGEQKVVLPWSELRIQREPPAGAQPESPGARSRADGQGLIALVDQAAIDRAPRYTGPTGVEGERPPAASPGTERERQPDERPSERPAR